LGQPVRVRPGGSQNADREIVGWKAGERLEVPSWPYSLDTAMSLQSDPLPRQTYKTEKDALSEESIAADFAEWTGAEQLKIGNDPTDRQKSRVDRAFYRGKEIVAFAEIKNYPRYAFGQIPYWTLSLKKVETMQALQAIVRVPVLFILGFNDGTIAFFDVTKAKFDRVEKFGRDDRGDPADYEPGARFQWSQFKKIST
jgi:hypothetical protein